MSKTNRSTQRQRPAYEVYAAEQRLFNFFAYGFLAILLVGGVFFIICRAMGVF
jgi:hypothetical protein